MQDQKKRASRIYQEVYKLTDNLLLVPESLKN